MGLTVKEMLKSNLFEGYRLLAGGSGLDKQIQGIAVLDAPDGYKWTKGKELVVSSGYIFKENPGLWEEFVNSEKFKFVSCMGIKDRFIKEIPENILSKFNESGIPLLLIPPHIGWMDIMNSLNVIVMNKDIQQFRIGSISTNFSDLSYHVRKIERILSQIEERMGFPAMLYDLSDDTAYFSSENFPKIADKFTPKDFFEHNFPVTEEIICENLQFIRYRYTTENASDVPYSWLSIPITVMGKVKAYFVVVEATSLIDYFDEFAMRISFLLLQSIYEQFLFFDSVGDFGFEKFVNDILFNKLYDHEKISIRAVDINIDVTKKYYTIVMDQSNADISLSDHKDIINRTIKTAFQYENIRIAFVTENSVMIVYQVNDSSNNPNNVSVLKNYVMDLKIKLEDKLQNPNLRFGIYDTQDLIYNLRRNYKRCIQAINMGRLVYYNQSIVTYSELGPLAWINIDDVELQAMMNSIKDVLDDSESEELLDTLKYYLDYRMNYSLTSKHMYVHINTVRKRIEKVRELLGIDLEDPVNRLKLELFLMVSKKLND
ncbi:PucR family transcriptional regulator [Gudongella sp. SC589]|uniref:PucR family transcriptional regulator n=1 Tax=Gudongella sp. SC589 TaxID=3385990 RepID=UPI0039049352